MEEGWKQVYQTTEEYQAYIARDMLKEAGIQSVILNQKDSMYLNFGEYRIFVPDNESERASEILKNLIN